MKLNKIVQYLNKLLNIEQIPDDSLNGLQLDGVSEVKKICFAVDVSRETIEKAISLNAQMLIVHHGLFWKNNVYAITGHNYKRFSKAIKSGLSVYAAHLPLDIHNKYGNNIVIANKLKLKKIKMFGNYKGIDIGYSGLLSSSISYNEFLKLWKKKVCDYTHILNVNDKVHKIGICSGGGASLFYDCKKNNIDTFITGEVDYVIKNLAEELNINLLFAGHYNTETFGVNALSKHLKVKFPSLNVEFIDIPSDL